ncbi:hypothetical protein EYF80_009351 [Liparis tanakae]|uniref:Uncharacterized protein n=1 Tax=Liparis tanakae TaxID=230148 RepID=A0A4Z2IRE4_9TELE|nr:hypothetical protein EYF80_009351 [Liparis tanakae]
MLSAGIEYEGAGLPSALTGSAHTEWRQEFHIMCVSLEDGEFDLFQLKRRRALSARTGCPSCFDVTQHWLQRAQETGAVI